MSDITCCASRSSTGKAVRFLDGDGSVPTGIRRERAISTDDLLLVVEYIFGFLVGVR